MQAFKAKSRRYFSFPRANLDTDQIIPAAFLKVTEKTGLGAAAFHQFRYDAKGEALPDSPFAGLDWEDRRILIAGPNFGCGSSREHAVWALQEFGIEIILAESFGDIFQANALKNGLLVIALPRSTLDRWREQGQGELLVDLESLTIFDQGEALVQGFPLESFARYCLLHGTDSLSYLLAAEEAISRFEGRAYDKF